MVSTLKIPCTEYNFDPGGNLLSKRLELTWPNVIVKNKISASPTLWFLLTLFMVLFLEIH